MIVEAFAAAMALTTVGFAIESVRVHVLLTREERKREAATAAQVTAERMVASLEVQRAAEADRNLQLKMQLERVKREKEGLYARLREAGVPGAGDALDDDLRRLYEDANRPR